MFYMWCFNAVTKLQTSVKVCHTLIPLLTPSWSVTQWLFDRSLQCHSVSLFLSFTWPVYLLPFSTPPPFLHNKINMNETNLKSMTCSTMRRVSSEQLTMSFPFQPRYPPKQPARVLFAEREPLKNTQIIHQNISIRRRFKLYINDYFVISLFNLFKFNIYFYINFKFDFFIF